MAKLRKICSILVFVAMLVSVFSVTAFAEETSYNVDSISGTLSLEKYVVENDGSNSVSIACYGQFTDGTIEPDASFSGALEVYLDKELTELAVDVTATVGDGQLTLSGIDTVENVVYYLSDGVEGHFYTPFYVVNDQTTASITLTLADGQVLDLSQYAPDGSTSDIYIGGNQGLMSVEDFSDLDDVTDEEKAVAEWWLGAGVTNSGATLTTFGEYYYVFELAVYLYRNFQIVIDDNTYADGFVEPTDCSGDQPSNDQYSDAVGATLPAGIWDGIYTQWVDENGVARIDNIDNEVTELGCASPVDEEVLLVTLYNALTSDYAHLSEAGEAIKNVLLAGGASDNESKVVAVEEALDIDCSTIFDEASSQKLAVLTVLNKLDGCTTPITSTATTTATDDSGDTIYVPASMEELVTMQTETNLSSSSSYSDTNELLSSESTSLYVTDGTVNLTNAPITGTGDNTAAGEIVGEMSFNPGPMFESGYNLVAGNAYYRMGVGALLIARGADTIVNLTSTNGVPVAFAVGNGSMAGILHNTMGGTINVTNGIVYSANQHPSNTVYNGTLHYYESAVLSAGRQYSSDFWGGNIVFENSVSVGQGFADEPTTVIYKNSYTNLGSIGSSSGSINVTGLASLYLENSVVDNGSVNFTNNTSGLTDTGSLAMVNSVWNGASIGTVTRSDKAVITLVDSILNLTSDTILTTSQNITSSIYDKSTDEQLIAMYEAAAAIYVYGDVEVNTVSGSASFDVADTTSITLYVSEIVGDLDISNITVVYGDEYGVLTVSGEGDSGNNESGFVDVNSDAWYNEALNYVIENGLMIGTSDATFEPDSTLNRAMLAQILYNMEGQPEVTGESTFTDVTADEWYHDAIVWAAGNGIVQGVSDTTYAPLDDIAREQFATMLYRYAEMKGYDTSVTGDLSAFTDKESVSDWANEAVAWAVGVEILRGYGDGILNPLGGSTRAEAAQMLYNYNNMVQ